MVQWHFWNASLDIRLHLAELSLSEIILKTEKFGVKRSRKAVHNWVQKADE